MPRNINNMTAEPLAPALPNADLGVRGERLTLLNGHAAKPEENRSITAIPRDTRGRFLPGCPAGPGRPPKTKEQQNLELLHDFIKPEYVTALVSHTLQHALAGDPRARELLYKYLFPTPVETQDIRMLQLQAQLNGGMDEADVVEEPWNQEDAAETLAQAYGVLEELGIIASTALGRTLPSTEHDDSATGFMENDFVAKHTDNERVID
jgi:hypothetical protein